MEDTADVETVEETPPPPGPGERLRAAREAAGTELTQVAAETRIPLRHLQLIEADDFGALPARTYAIGFARSYAKVVGLDEDQIADEVRAELAALDTTPLNRAVAFEPGDPARVPGGNVIWIAAAAVLALLVVGYFGYNSLFAPAAELPSLIPEEQPTQPAARASAGVPSAAQAAGGPVVFTALAEGVWVKFYDASGAQLMQKQMAEGERYVVPPEANGPQLWTGRPDALAITVGGRPIPRLAEREQVMKDVPVTPAALLARSQPPAPAAAASPATGAPAPPASPARRATTAPPPAAAPAPAPEREPEASPVAEPNPPTG